jgi:hypothetical protein
MKPFVVAERNPLRSLLLGLAGLLLIIAAIEVLWVHRVSLDPERDSNGNLTTRGLAQLRADIVWGGSFLVVGGTMFAVALYALFDGRPVAELSEEGMSLRVGGPRTPVFVPWEEVLSVRSGRDFEEGSTRPIPVLMVGVDHPERFPSELWGAEWDGDVLKVDAAGWTPSPEFVAAEADLELQRRAGKAPPRGPSTDGG